MFHPLRNYAKHTGMVLKAETPKHKNMIEIERMNFMNLMALTAFISVDLQY
ncbi:hypothetical protein A5A_023269 [Vibrio cholerae MZO-2]|nr:hypothetical protein [Vibrio cholerae]EGQ8188505.1 hypothetical protein [Vibrio cholerae]EJH60831.1 hypothetical protein VCHE45_2920 [Vibrio cholerae HE-45]KNA48173.1 hypothetical protein A5A_023269 [Vibrio cholerae MZO-2]